MLAPRTALSCEKSCRDGLGCGEGRRLVAPGLSHELRFIARSRRLHVGRTNHPLENVVIGRALDEGPRFAKSVQRNVDEIRVFLSQNVGAESQPVDDSVAKVLEKDIRVFHERFDQFESVRFF